MTWWAWILEIAGLILLALAIFYGARNTLRKTPAKPFSLLVAAAAALFAAVSFALLTPTKPPARILVLLGITGLIAGALTVLPARAPFKDGELRPSQGYWYLVAWSSALFVSSVLVVIGPTASRVASCITVFASAGVLCYSTVLYTKYRFGMREGPVTAAPSRPPDLATPSFCRSCGEPVRLADGKASRFCTKCGGELA
jgi:hypothetical protein